MSTFSCPVVTIASVEHNPNSDNLDVLKFEEIFWVCQDVRGKRKVGDKVVYIPIDAMVDCTRPEFKFIEKNAKIRDGKPIARIKTIRLRGATSQGLVIDLPDITGAWEHGEIPIGYDLSEYFGVTKYEPPQEAVFSANAKGTFPVWCPKTDCERYQNHNRTIEPFINDLWFATLKLDGCLPRNAYITSWNGKTYTIRDIVEKRLKLTLVGVDKNGGVVPTSIVKYFNNGRKDYWMDIYFRPTIEKKAGCRSKKLRVTVNHSIFTDRGEVIADNLDLHDRLVSYYTSLSDSALHVIESSLLGDGCIITKLKRGWAYNESHKKEHKQYIDYIQHCLGGEDIVRIRRYTSGFGSIMFRLGSNPYHSLMLLHKKWYKNGKKIIPQDLTWVDDFSVAKWYMDDGSLAHSELQQDRALFATNCFNQKDVIRLAKHLTKMYGVTCNVYNSKGWTIRVNNANNTIDTMWKAITPYIVPCMRYKVPIKFRDIPFKSLPQGKEIKSKCLVPITKIKRFVTSRNKLNHGLYAYDLETTTHNYMCGSVLVHNSSMTVFYDSTRTGDEFGVCSRNQELKPPSQDPSSSAPTKYGFSIDSYWKAVIDYQLLDKVNEIATVGGYTQVALQFELCGEGIQKNRLGLKGQKPFLFDIYVTMPGVSRYLDYMIFLTLAHRFSIETVPFVSIKEQPLTYFAGSEMNKFQELLDTLKYENGQLAEGGVFTYWLEKEVGKLGRLRVKYINPNYLLQSEKHDD